VVHTPGHTDGEVSFLLPDNQAIVGDTIFEGGPGRTNNAPDFRTMLSTLHTILQWPDDTMCYPGHGSSFRLGDIRSHVEAFVARDHGDDFHGDAEW
jgi:glyoxylase-like metal-dependent hydrolase (beta-lactamase superfamily II)